MKPGYILGDAHLAPDAPDRVRAFTDFVRRAAEEAADLLVMGDLFRVWMGPPRFHGAFEREVLALFSRAREAGGKVTFVVGNRDLLLPAPGLPFDHQVMGEELISFAGRRLYVAHGDGLDPQDRAYRRLRSVLRHPWTRTASSLVPGALGRGLAAFGETVARNRNQYFKTGAWPEAPLRALGQRARAAGAEAALLGHFHRHVVVEAAVPVVIAPPFEAGGSVLDARLVPVPIQASERVVEAAGAVPNT